MKDFNSYINQQKQTTKNQSSQIKQEQNQGANEDLLTKFSKIASQYEGVSQDEMMQAIIQEANRSRKNGTLSDSEIKSFSTMIRPLLNSSQSKMLDKVLKNLLEK